MMRKGIGRLGEMAKPTPYPLHRDRVCSAACPFGIGAKTIASN